MMAELQSARRPPGLEKAEVRSHYGRFAWSPNRSNLSTNPVQTWSSCLQVSTWWCSFTACWYDLSSRLWLIKFTIGRAWKSRCYSNTESSHAVCQLFLSNKRILIISWSINAGSYWSMKNWQLHEITTPHHLWIKSYTYMYANMFGSAWVPVVWTMVNVAGATFSHFSLDHFFPGPSLYFHFLGN